MTDADRREFLQSTAGALAALAIQPSAEVLGTDARNQAPLRVGLIGAGKQGRAIMAEAQKLPQLEVAAICDTIPGRLRSGLRRAPGAQAHDDYRRVLDDQMVTAVCIATPTHRHREIAIAALDAGKHVYCEAPLAATVEDAQAIARAARGAAGRFQCGMLARSNPIYKLARSFYRSGAVRDLASLRAQDNKKTSWRIPASSPELEAALNWRLDPAVSIGLPGERGCHQFDAISWFIGRYPVAVRGDGGVFFYQDGREIADTVQCSLRFDDGVRLSWESTLTNSYGSRYEVYTGSMAAIKLAWTAGWLFKEADAPTQGWEVYANRESFANDEGITLIADATKLAKQGQLKDGVGLPHPPLYYALADFAASIDGNREVACSAGAGLRAAVVGILAHRAVTTGDEIAIDPTLFEVGR